MYYETKAKITQADGKVCKESYLVSAESVSNAEETISKELAAVGYDYTIESVKETKYLEVFEGKREVFYAATIGIITVDEKTGNEKRIPNRYLIPATDFNDAYTNLKNGMHGTISDYDIVSLVETKIVEVYD